MVICARSMKLVGSFQRKCGFCIERKTAYSIFGDYQNVEGGMSGVTEEKTVKKVRIVGVEETK